MKYLVFTLERGPVIRTPPGYVFKLPGPKVLDVTLSRSSNPVTFAVSEVVSVELVEEPPADE